MAALFLNYVLLYLEQVHYFLIPFLGSVDFPINTLDVHKCLFNVFPDQDLVTWVLARGHQEFLEK